MWILRLIMWIKILLIIWHTWKSENWKFGMFSKVYLTIFENFLYLYALYKVSLLAQLTVLLMMAHIIQVLHSWGHPSLFVRDTVKVYSRSFLTSRAIDIKFLLCETEIVMFVCNLFGHIFFDYVDLRSWVKNCHDLIVLEVHCYPLCDKDFFIHCSCRDVICV